jgi:flagellar biosynthetic protein FliQ
MDLTIDLVRETLFAAGVLLAGPLALGLLLGCLLAAFQAITSIHDPTIALVPRLLAVGALLGALTPWILGQLVDFATRAFAGAGTPWSGG